MTRENIKCFFKANLRELRRGRNINQSQLTTLIGVKTSTIGAMEEGRAMSIDIVYKIAKAFNLSLDDLLTKSISGKSKQQDYEK